MIRLLSIAIDVLSSSIVLIPAILFLIHIFLRPCSIKKTIWIVIFALYLRGVFSVTGCPSIYSMQISGHFNWIPFLDIRNSPLGYMKNMSLNILLFVPFGFFLPIIWERCRSIKQTALMGFGLSMAIEISQIFTLRATDVDDLIANTAGAAIGFLTARIFLQRADAWMLGEDEASQAHEPFLIIGACFFVMFLAHHPFLSEAIWGWVLDSPLWQAIK